MRIVLALLATVLVLLGLWLMAAGFMPAAASAGPAGTQISAPTASTAGPIMLGLALLAGGVLFFVLILRR
ncbi:MAG: hypothetical protein ABIR29_08330, partial [Chthoniobacterales bacterium]